MQPRWLVLPIAALALVVAAWRYRAGDDQWWAALAIGGGIAIFGVLVPVT